MFLKPEYVRNLLLRKESCQKYLEVNFELYFSITIQRFRLRFTLPVLYIVFFFFNFFLQQ